MNERIEKLAEGCFEYFEPNCNGETMEFNYKKFAELIVQECCKALESTDRHRSDYFIAKVKEHFGVDQ